MLNLTSGFLIDESAGLLLSGAVFFMIFIY